LLGETVAHFGLGISLLDLLQQVAALVRDFYQKLGHLPLFCGRSPARAGPSKSNIPTGIGFAHLLKACLLEYRK
jgi:hypothetical protein